MRRKEKEITSQQEIMEILNEEKVCRVAMVDGDAPYVVPLNYGYEIKNEQYIFYVHSANSGRKIDCLKANPNVCLVIDQRHQLMPNERACDYSFAFRSIIVEGTAEFLQGTEDKLHALTCIMDQQDKKESYQFSPKYVEEVAVIKISVIDLCGKRED